MASESLTTLLAELLAADVELILVGGLAAAAQGAPIATFDVDIVHRRTPDNVARLLAVLDRLGAVYRGRPGGPELTPTAALLGGLGHSLLMTRLGPLDVLGAIEGGRDYDRLVNESAVVELAGRPLRVLRLETIVELKRASSHAKDRARLPILEETLRRLRGG